MSSKNVTSTQDFVFVSDELRLAGTIEKPSREASIGSVLLLSGSGPQDRDESIAGKKPFSVLSHAFASWGYQVFRWDDRGVGESDGDYLAASETHLVNDVVNAMSAIERQTDFDKHVLVGHSQGTLIAAAVAANQPSSVSHLILLAGMGLPGRAGLLDQHVRICEAEGWSDDDIRLSLAQKEVLFDMLSEAQSEIDTGKSKMLVLQNLKTNLLDAFLGDVGISYISSDERCKLESTIEDLLEWEWRYLLGVDPSEDLLRVMCPVLAVCGDTDSQVHAEGNLSLIESACIRGKAPCVEVHIVEDHNHLFQKTSSAAMSDYEALGPPFTGEVLSIIRLWLSRKRN